MSQIEREYREALDGVRFSHEAKERIMDNLMEGNKQPVKGKRFRPLRAGLIAAAACAALLGTAGAANVIARQASIRFFDSQEEMIAAQLEGQDPHEPGAVVVNGGPNGWDYDELASTEMETWWEGPGWEGPGIEMVEDAAGMPEDGWTARRVFEYQEDGKTYSETRYRAQRASDYVGLWVGLDTSWLEERYAGDPEHLFFRTVAIDGEPYRTGLFAEYRGDGDTVFNVQYFREEGHIQEDEYRLSTGYEYTGYYTTRDGVETAIEMSTSHTGKSLFWVHFSSGQNSFSMFGTQVELDELYSILDSLHLSNLLEYQTE